MIVRLIDFCLRERLVVLLVAAALAVYGWYATQTVPLDAIPDIGENQVIVLSEWPGQSPKDMEDQITFSVSGSRKSQAKYNTYKSNVFESFMPEDMWLYQKGKKGLF